MLGVLSEEVAKVVVSQCSHAGVEGVLRRAQREGKDVRISAATKHAIVNENLRRAVAEGHVPLNAVYDLIADTEESAPQVHFYYAPTHEGITARLNNGSAVATAIHGANWAQVKGFPKPLDEPDGEQWADFRIVPNGWIAKMYRGGQRWVLDHSESVSSETRRVKVWVRKYKREVWTVRWYADQSLLSMRLPIFDQKDDLQEARQALWRVMGNALQPTEFTMFSLAKAATTIAVDETGLGGEIRPGASWYKNSKGGNAYLAPQGEGESLHNTPEFRAATKLFKVANEIVVYWQPTIATDNITKELRTVIGSKGLNSLLFSAESCRKTVEHVVKRVIELQKAV